MSEIKMDWSEFEAFIGDGAVRRKVYLKNCLHWRISLSCSPFLQDGHHFRVVFRKLWIPSRWFVLWPMGRSTWWMRIVLKVVFILLEWFSMSGRNEWENNAALIGYCWFWMMSCDLLLKRLWDKPDGAITSTVWRWSAEEKYLVEFHWIHLFVSIFFVEAMSWDLMINAKCRPGRA